MLNLGHIDSFATLPSEVVINERQYFLVGDKDGYRLISRVCSHSGGTVIDEGSCFECPLHGWRYDRSTGQGITAPTAQLTNVPVIVKDRFLWADIDEKEEAPASTNISPKGTENLEIKAA